MSYVKGLSLVQSGALERTVRARTEALWERARTSHRFTTSLTHEK